MFVCMRKYPNIYPNASNANEIFLFDAENGYRCVEHWPFENSPYLGCGIIEIENYLDIYLPNESNYAYFRFKDHRTTIRQSGRYLTIFNNKIQIYPHGQNS